MREEFLNKLADLLAEYNADISFNCDGDTYGIYNDKMEISINNEVVLSIKNDWYLDKDNIREKM